MRRRSASNKGILTQEEFAAQFSHPAAQATGHGGGSGRARPRRGARDPETGLEMLLDLAVA
jgi:hypothetical protein